MYVYLRNCLCLQSSIPFDPPAPLLRCSPAQVRINANLKAATVEELRGRKRAMHLAAFDYTNAETARTLARLAAEGSAEERVARDPFRSFSLQAWLQTGGKEEDLAECVVTGDELNFTVEGLLGKLRRCCEAVRTRHGASPAERFAVDGAYRALAEEMLATSAAAVSCLRLYLEDQDNPIEALMRTSMMTSHRAYVGFLWRTLPAAGEARAAAAGRLCQALGLMEASPDEVDAEGFTPLMRAAVNGSGARVLQSLAAARADLEARDGERNRTAFFLAAEAGHAEVVEALGQLGADVDATADPAFQTAPVYIAAQNGFVEVVEVLGQLGADVNRALLDGRTPMYAAAQMGHTAVIEALGRLGADPNRANNIGRTPLGVAHQNTHWEAAAALERLGGR